MKRFNATRQAGALVLRPLRLNATAPAVRPVLGTTDILSVAEAFRRYAPSRWARAQSAQKKTASRLYDGHPVRRQDFPHANRNLLASKSMLASTASPTLLDLFSALFSPLILRFADHR